LSLVARLEEFPRSAVERVGPQEVVQYRGEIMPLIDVSHDLPRLRRRKQTRASAARRPAEDSRETIQVVVYAGTEQRVGLIVHEILDIVEETSVARAPARRPGVLGTAVIQGRVTEFLDVESILRGADPAFIERPRTSVVEA
jgi:two-component system chemotaxis sensor kinase CheA